jgi:alcohol dehydrogenase
MSRSASSRNSAPVSRASITSASGSLSARANLAPIPAGLDDEAALMCPDIFSTGLSGAESGTVRVGDSVAVFAQGPIGLCATIGAKLRGASLIIGVDGSADRLETARRFGANVTLNIHDGDPVPGSSG